MNKFVKSMITGIFFVLELAMTNGCASTPEGQQAVTEETAAVAAKGEVIKAGDEKSKAENGFAKEEPSEEEDTATAVSDIKGRSSSDLKVPQTVEQYKLSKVVRISPDAVQAVYKNTESEGKILTVTKAYGNIVPNVLIPNYTAKNISYRAEKLKGLSIILGTENSLCRSASWVSGDFGFAFMADEGFTYENLDSFVQQIY